MNKCGCEIDMDCTTISVCAHNDVVDEFQVELDASATAGGEMQDALDAKDAEIERQSEMIQAMEAVMSEIGETLGVTPGDVPILMIRIGNGIRAQAKVTRQQAEIERLQKQLDEFVYAEANPNYVSEAERLEAENGRLRAAQVWLYNQGYSAGHEDTVEGRATHIVQADIETYHDDVVADLLTERQALPEKGDE